MAFSDDGFDSSVKRPPGLTIAHIRAAINFVEDRAEELIDLYYEQANIFSGVVGILGVRALDSLSPYKRHKHPDTAQQRSPDLSLRGRLNPPAIEALESKGSTRPWSIQSHYNHAGWYIVWRYGVDPTKGMKPPKRIFIWRVDLPFLSEEHWKYEGSKCSRQRWKNAYLRRLKSQRGDPEGHNLPSTNGPVGGRKTVLVRSKLGNLTRCPTRYGARRPAPLANCDVDDSVDRSVQRNGASISKNV